MRIRVNFEKSGSLIYTSVLDVQKIWERSFRRAGLKIQYSKGFHPQPRIQIANPLPVGFIGRDELVDVWLEEEISPDKVVAGLAGKLPEGLSINQIKVVEERSPAPVNLVRYSDYIVIFFDETTSYDRLSMEFSQLLERESIPRVRNRKSYDLRPLIHTISIENGEEGLPLVSMRLSSSPGKTGRPEEVLFELGYELSDFKVERTRLILGEPEK